MHKEKKLHFMHLPKTGGASLSNFLDTQFKSHEICPYFFLRSSLSWIPQEQILTDINDKKIFEYKFFKGHLGWVPRTVFSDDEMETFTFLRDPIIRSLSYYNFYKGTLFNLDNTQNRWETFDDFVFDKEPGGLESRSNWQTKWFCADLFFLKSFDIPPHLYIKNLGMLEQTEIDLPQNKIISLAVERLNRCSFIGLTEKYNESFEQLCMQYKWLPPRKTPKQNVSRRLIEISQLSSRTLDRVRELNQLDFVLYENAVKIFEERKKVRVFFDRAILENEIAQKSTPLQTVKFTFADRIIGEGWHAREGEQPNLFSWNSAIQSTLVFIVKNQSDLLISFKIVHTLLADLHKKLNLVVNSFPIELTHHFHPDGKLVFEGKIPMSALSRGNFLELFFSIPEVICPKDICAESQDMRSLGFALQELEINPAT